MKNLIKATIYVIGGTGLLIAYFALCLKFTWLANATLVVTIAMPVLLLICALKKILDERGKRR